MILFKMENKKLISVLFLLLVCSNEITSFVFHEPMENNEHQMSNNLKINGQYITGMFEHFVRADDFGNFSKCKEKYEIADYPYETIMDALNITEKDLPVKNMQQKSVSFPSVLLPRISSSEPSLEAEASNMQPYVVSKPAAPYYECEELHDIIYPIKSTGSDGIDYYIINVHGFQQRTKVTKCYKRDYECGDPSTFPETYTYKCKEKIEMVEFSVFRVGDDITKDKRTTRKFPVAKGCSCELVKLKNDD